LPIWVGLGPKALARRRARRAGGRRMSEAPEVESRFTGMIVLLARVLSIGRDGRFVTVAGPTMGYAVRRPRRA